MRMLPSYRTISGQGEAEMVIQKSQFIGYALPVETEEAALEFIQTIKKKHRDATHNVSAYIIGEQNEIQRFSDDGEPSGTAGIPILDVLKKEGLHNTVVVVTRYFGGIKLGTGGLVRAYTNVAKLALEAAEIVTKTLYQIVQVIIDYSLLGMMQNQLRIKNYMLKDTVYAEDVTLMVYVPISIIEQFQVDCIEWTNSHCTIRLGEIVYL